MFGTSENRLAGLLWDGVDVLLEFATLGEYRLPDRPERCAEHPSRPGREALAERSPCARPPLEPMPRSRERAAPCGGFEPAGGSVRVVRHRAWGIERRAAPLELGP